MGDLLLIDGKNLCHRVYWTHKELSYGGSPVGMLYGFMNSLVLLKKKFGSYFFVVAWEGGSKRRKAESAKAVEEGLIPSGYKANREKRAEDDDDLEEFDVQFEVLKEKFLPQVKVLQARVSGYEADDVIHTYAAQNAERDGQTVVVSSDRDFMYLLQYPNVTIYDAMKQATWTRSEFDAEFGFDPALWVDVGAIMGDNSDNIHGVRGWGVKYASKYIREYGDMDAVIAAIEAKPEKKRGKKEQALLDNVEVIRLAKSLKQMDMVPFPPKLRFTKQYKQKSLEALFMKYGFKNLMNDVWRLVV
jgi:DNA polymerase-1